MPNIKRIQVAIVISVGLIFLVFPALAVAQEEAPLRLVYLNLADDRGTDSFETVEEMLEGTDQIDLLDGDDFIDTANRFGVEKDSFSGSEQRRDLVDEFAGAMWQMKVEGVLVHGIDDDGSGEATKLEIAVIGPRGWEVAEVDHTLEQGFLDEEQAIQVLRDLFSALVPEVRGFRRDVEEQTLGDDDFMSPPAEVEKIEEEEQASPRDLAVAEHRRRYGNLERNIALRIGPMMGYRSLRMNEEEGSFDLHQGTPLFGIGARADGLITTFDRDTAALEAGGFIGYSPISVAYGDGELGGQFIRLGAEARYISARSAILQLRAIGGVETMNISIEANQDYTGHGYLVGRLGGGIRYRIGALMTVEIDALFMPIMMATNSGGAYGDVEGWLGLGGDLAVHLNLFDPILAEIRYSGQYFDLDYPDPDSLGSAAHSRDLLHQIMIGVGYRL